MTISRAAILFDLDGTLFRSERVTVPAVQRTLTAAGIALPSPNEIMRCTGRPIEQFHAWLRGLCPPGQAEQVAAAVDALELALIRTEGALYRGVREMLETLRAEGHVLALCSNGPLDYVDEVLDSHALRPYFEVTRCRGMGYPGKIEMAQEILAQWGLPGNPLPNGPQVGIVVGDREDDVGAAHAHGAWAIGVSYGFGSRGELRGADAIVHAASEIPLAVHRLLARVAV